MIKASGVGGQASVPMNLFATWEIDRSAANCIPRICSMTICKLTVLRELDKEVQSVFIAVKMQGSKRVFRSNEIFLLSNGLVDTTLELTFSLQYPHFVKRNENRLQILLQRKKRYKNRAILGYKTLAIYRVDMAHLIQCPIPNGSTFNLLAVQKDQDATVSVAARIVVSNMSSLPIDFDVDNERVEKQETALERSPEVDNFSDDDEETLSSDADLGSDIPQDFADDESRSQKRKSRRKVRVSSSSRQQNFIKTKVAALLKKFKQVSEEELDPALAPDQDVHPVHHDEYDFLYDDLEGLNFSDSCPEMDDNISIVSTPKPKLRPFFDRISHSSSQAEISSLKEHLEQQDYLGEKFSPSSPRYDNEYNDKEIPPGKAESWEEGRTIPKSDNSLSIRETEEITNRPGPVSRSANNSPEMRTSGRHESGEKIRSRIYRDPSFSNSTPKDFKSLIPQTETVTDFLSRLENDDSLPENILLVDGNDKLACSTGNTLAVPGIGLSKPVLTRSNHDVQLVFGGFLARLQKYLNRNSLPLLPVKIAVVGSNIYLSVVLRQFVDSLSPRSSEWQSLLLFYIIPTGCSRLSRYISSVDATYGSIFAEPNWKESVDKLAEISPANLSEQHPDFLEVATKLREYISEAFQVLPLAIAEAMFTFRQRSSDEASSQKFMPFISEVKVGENDVINVTDLDKEDCLAPVLPSGTAPLPSTTSAAATLVTPPPSPSVVVTSSGQGVAAGSGSGQVPEVKLGLQVDYWKEKDSTKYSLKTNFKSFHVTCLPNPGERSQNPALALDVVTRGKKNLMRLPGKKGKEKDADSKSQAVGNINRLICTSKHQNSLLQVKIDGVEWKDVKFFQLSAHWSSHVKALPVAVFTA